MTTTIASSGTTATAQAATTTQTSWSVPTALGYGWFPDIAADSSGQVHVVWSSGIKSYDVVLYSSSHDGQQWTKPNDIEARPSLGAVTRPTIAIDDAGMLHLTFKDYTAFYSHGPASGISASTLLPAEQISKGAGAYFTQIAAGPNQILHLIYTENVPSAACSVCFHVYYRQSADGGANWSAAVDVSAALPTGSAKPTLVVDVKGDIFVAWESGRGGDLGQLLATNATVVYSASYDNGKTWSTPREFKLPDAAANATSLTDQGGRDIALGLDGQGRLMAVWLYLPDDIVYYSVSADSGRTWTTAAALDGVWGRWSIQYSKLDDYTMATDGDGNIHLVMVGRTSDDKKLLDTQKSLQLLHLVWNAAAGTWSTPEVIMNYPVFGRLNGVLAGDYPEWPRIAIANGNRLHAVWFVRDSQNLYGDTSGYRVWYSRTLVDARYIQPAPLPTVQASTSTAAAATAAIAASAVVPASTPVSTSTAVVYTQPVASNTSQSESNVVIILAKALAPAGALVIVAVLAVMVWRRYSRR